jgi:hypothetical protein
MREQLKSTIEALIPKSVDDIIRGWRDRGRIHLALTQELMTTLPAMVEVMTNHKSVKDKLNDWFVIAITIDGKTNYSLVGTYDGRERIVMTSGVKSIDFASNFALTRNSLYALGPKAQRDPTMNELLHICATLHSWGIHKSFEVPEIFY